MPLENPFIVLGLPPDASEEEIRHAWKRHLTYWHPDHHGEQGLQHTKQLNKAYQALKDPHLRQYYAQELIQTTQTPPVLPPATPSSPKKPPPSRQFSLSLSHLFFSPHLSSPSSKLLLAFQFTGGFTLLLVAWLVSVTPFLASYLPVPILLLIATRLLTTSVAYFVNWDKEQIINRHSQIARFFYPVGALFFPQLFLPLQFIHLLYIYRITTPRPTKTTRHH